MSSLLIIDTFNSKEYFDKITNLGDEQLLNFLESIFRDLSSHKISIKYPVKIERNIKDVFPHIKITKDSFFKLHIYTDLQIRLQGSIVISNDLFKPEVENYFDKWIRDSSIDYLLNQY